MRQMPKEAPLQAAGRHVAREHGEGERGRHRAQGRRDPQPARVLQGAARVCSSRCRRGSHTRGRRTRPHVSPADLSRPSPPSPITRAGAEGAERLPRGEAALLPALLLPLERRAVGDPLGDEGPHPRPAAPGQVLRGIGKLQFEGGERLPAPATRPASITHHPTPLLRREHDHGDDLAGGRGRLVRRAGGAAVGWSSSGSSTWRRICTGRWRA